LSSRTEKDLFVDAIYNGIYRDDGLSPKYVPTLQEILELNKGKEKRKEEKLERDKQRSRSVYFCIGYSNIWKEERIHKILKKLRNKFDLQWLQISLS
jgi:hypothetical protein